MADIKKHIENTRKNLRASVRMGAIIGLLPVAAAITVIQGGIIGPLTGNYTALPNFSYAVMRKVLGYKVKFSENSAPKPDKTTISVFNHQAVADFAVVGGKIDGVFIGKGDIMDWPGIAQFAKSTKFIGVRRKSEFNAQNRGKIAQALNEKRNVGGFFEGTTTDGSKIARVRAALLEFLFDGSAEDKNHQPVELKEDVRVQAAAIVVKSVNGKDATNDDDLRNMYSMKTETYALRRLWKRLQIKETTFEITRTPARNPKDMANVIELAHQMELDLASVVNPGQTVFEKAAMPTKAWVAEQRALQKAAKRQAKL